MSVKPVASATVFVGDGPPVSGGQKETTHMVRKPNYKFERQERQRAKDAKKAMRLEAKKEKTEKRNAENDGIEPVGDDAPKG
ncbi:MAG TPA: hypothetical protein ENI72_03110 [Rhodospirillales bacterium]|nr:hypothetical protein [Rhodospirillales bacterium]